jgi:anhydro-N-acetylmuramic acid kinase
MSGSSLDGLDIVFVELEESRGTWSYTIKSADCYAYNEVWQQRLSNSKKLNAYDYMVLHTAYGKFLGESVNRFVEEHNLHHRVQLIVSHGHTVFHAPELNMTAQLGDGATIAAITGINVVSDLRAVDVALGGQGAPIVPIGEKLLLPGFNLYLNIGGIANLSLQSEEEFIAFDVCPANRILNMLALREGKEFDEDGQLAKDGSIHKELLDKLNGLEYYHQRYPKSLSNDFGTDVVYPVIESVNINIKDALRTYTEHIAFQISLSIQDIVNRKQETVNRKLLVTGGGAFNNFLIERLKENINGLHIEIIIPEDNLIKYKEALIMAMLGVLRWREENTVINSVTGAIRSSIGGAVWIGQEA